MTPRSDNPYESPQPEVKESALSFDMSSVIGLIIIALSVLEYLSIRQLVLG